MLASEALAITNKNTYRTDAINYGIKKLENDIKYYAELGRRECTCSFYAFPDTYGNFVEKYGKENRKHYSEYNIEADLKSYFEKMVSDLKELSVKIVTVLYKIHTG